MASKWRTWTLFSSVLTILIHGVATIRMVDLKVPSHVVRNNPVRMECHYDLEGEALYSVKWYKDGREFFRFLPGDEPPEQIFHQTGVAVDMPHSSDTAVALKTVDYDSTGHYKCEVSGEAPSFRTVSHAKEMFVVDLPKEGPHIEGGRPRYAHGDTVSVNCTSPKSRPAATLNWFVNGDSADDAYLRRYPTIMDEEGLETVILGLEFKVRPKHFHQGDLKLKCLATIAQLYWRSNEESVEGDRPQGLPVLESREAFKPGKREASSHLSTNNDAPWIPTTTSSSTIKAHHSSSFSLPLLQLIPFCFLLL